ncbi:GNAT family N-acetyltransferase [Polyangium sp. 15x6]|uniref:GNAT family N-acetyltransferase n=1 Tax=Polyangium sp. 15x6 TaxID=3042687 RepID=UPI00249C9A3F|nr:GNAT family N-acetyltransferase [Polyangium sp. 15x6]MDI3291212.1 GNAT family N-acetyltransferase [Polyangium sp. 15x6]
MVDVRLVGPEHIEDLLLPIRTAFGITPPAERPERGPMTEFETRFVAYEEGAVVGGGGALSITLSVPGGGEVACAGLTMVAVMPTHRRRGVLTAMMRLHLDEARARKQALAALWTTEGPIYGRYGYGLASLAGDISLDRSAAAFADARPLPFSARLVPEAEAAERFPPIWENARKLHPGMPSRSPAWWRRRRLSDPGSTPAGGGPLQRVLIEIDGRPEAYALYHVEHKWDAHVTAGTVNVLEAMGQSPAGTRAVWRYLLDIDLMRKVTATNLPVDHPLFVLLAEPRCLHFTTYDALWTRIVDVPSALAARAYGARDSIVLDIEDTFCPWNTGRFRLDGGERRVTPTNDAPDLRLPIEALGSAYLGGVSFTQLADGGRVEVLTEGAAARADGLFRSARAPWCPEAF